MKQLEIAVKNLLLKLLLIFNSVKKDTILLYYEEC